VSWSRIRGHDEQIQAFDRVVKRGRLAHAYLFTGPDGIGKRLFAGELGKALLCESPPGQRLEACDTCAACRLLEAGTHPDLFVFRRPEERLEFPIELAQELYRSLALKPARGKHKIVVLEDADDLNEESSNCLLKTLEEPPAGSILILVGTSPERQLRTIVSRCQLVFFHPLPPTVLSSILGEHEIEDEAQRDRVSRLSGGSAGLALELADPKLWELRRALLEGLVTSKSNSVHLARQWTEFLDDTGKDAAAQRRRAALVLRMLIDFLNDVLRVSVGGEPRLAEPGDLPFLRKMSERLEPERCVQVLERCVEAVTQIDRRVQLVLVVEALMDALGDRLQAGIATR
jgi:DNA polymerase-3 subunit delta'